MATSALKEFNLLGLKVANVDQSRVPVGAWEGSSEGDGSTYLKIMLP